MFLREETEVEVNVSPEEAQQEIVEACLGLSELANASMQAGYSVHIGLQEGVLTEAEAEAKKQNIVARVAEKVKAFLVKIKNYVVAFFKGMAERLKKLWNRILGRGELISIPKSGKAAIDAAVKAYEDVRKVVSGEVGDVAKFSAAVSKAADAGNAAIVKLQTAVDKERKSGAVAQIRTSELSKVQAVSNEMINEAMSAERQLETAIKAADAAAKRTQARIARLKNAEKLEAANKEAEEDKKTVAEARAKADGWRQLTSIASKTAVIVSSVIGMQSAPAAK